MPLWAILLIVIGSAVFLGGVGVFVLGVVGWTFRAAPPPGPPPVANLSQPPMKQEVYTRAEFERVVLGKTTAEVKVVFGDPPVSGGGEGEETWQYRRLTKNLETGQVDAATEVKFRDSKATRVLYIDAAPPGGPGLAPGGPPTGK